MAPPQKQVATGRFTILSVAAEENVAILALLSNRKASGATLDRSFGSDVMNVSKASKKHAVSADPLMGSSMDCRVRDSATFTVQIEPVPPTSSSEKPTRKESKVPVATKTAYEPPSSETSPETKMAKPAVGKKQGATNARSIGSITILQHPDDPMDPTPSARQRQMTAPTKSIQSDPLAVSQKTKDQVLTLSQMGPAQVKAYEKMEQNSTSPTDEPLERSTPQPLKVPQKPVAKKPTPQQPTTKEQSQTKKKPTKSVAAPVVKSTPVVQAESDNTSTKTVSTGKFAMFHSPFEPVERPPAAVSAKKDSKSLPKIAFGSDIMSVKQKPPMESSGIGGVAMWAAEKTSWQHGGETERDAKEEKPTRSGNSRTENAQLTRNEIPERAVAPLITEKSIPPVRRGVADEVDSDGDKSTASTSSSGEMRLPRRGFMRRTDSEELYSSSDEKNDSSRDLAPNLPTRRSGRRRVSDESPGNDSAPRGPPSRRGVQRTATGDDELLIRAPAHKPPIVPKPTKVDAPPEQARQRRSGRRRQQDGEENAPKEETGSARGPPPRRGVQRTATGDDELLVRAPSARKGMDSSDDVGEKSTEPSFDKPEPRERRSGRRRNEDNSTVTESTQNGVHRGPPARRGVQRTATGDGELLVRTPSARKEMDSADNQNNGAETVSPSAPSEPRARRGGRRRNQDPNDADNEESEAASSTSRGPPTRRGVQRTATGDGELLVRAPPQKPEGATNAATLSSVAAAAATNTSTPAESAPPSEPRARRGGRRRNQDPNDADNEESEAASSTSRGPPTRRGVQRTATGDGELLVRSPQSTETVNASTKMSYAAAATNSSKVSQGGTALSNSSATRREPSRRGVQRIATGDDELFIRAPLKKPSLIEDDDQHENEANTATHSGLPPSREPRRGHKRGETSHAPGLHRQQTGDDEMLVRSPHAHNGEPNNPPASGHTGPPPSRERRTGRRRGEETHAPVFHRQETGDEEMLIRAPHSHPQPTEKRENAAVARPVEGNDENKNIDLDHVLLLIATESFEPNVKENQSKATLILDENKVKYETVDGVTNKTRRNQLFSISGMRGKYPQFFTVDKDGITRFWGTWSRFEETNENKRIADVFRGTAPTQQPESIKPSVGKQEPTKASDTLVPLLPSSERQVLMLISLQSFDREVVQNQQNATAILNSNGVKYTTLDGADPTNKERRNELFAISGLRAKYPQFFLIEGDRTLFWGDFEAFQSANDSKLLASQLGGTVATPPATNEECPPLKTDSDGSQRQKILVLVSLQSFDREVTQNQNNSISVLRAHGLSFETLDGADQANRDRRNELFEISGLRAKYPQFFIVDENQTTFWGDWKKFQTSNENKSLATDLLGSTPKVLEDEKAEKGKKIIESEEILEIESDNESDDAIDSEEAIRPQNVERSLNFASFSDAKITKSDETDITVFGATGFVAQHVVSYLLQTSIYLGQSIKVTLAGRNEAKLKKMKDQMTEKVKNLSTVNGSSRGKKASFDCFVAEASEIDKLRTMAARTKVVIGCAGPFRKYGSGVVAACAEFGTDYVDITCEVDWASEMRERYGQQSKLSGSRIVSFCGFDSIPSDLSVLAAVEELRKKTRSDAPIERATTWHALRGGLNGGTVLTAAATPVKPGNMLRSVPFFLFDPLALAQPAIRNSPDVEPIKARLARAEWANQMPVVHSFLLGGVSAPSAMAVVNNKVVHATALSRRYGPNFVYYERYLPVGFRYSAHLKLFSFIPALFVQAGMLLGIAALKMPLIGQILSKVFFPVGTGPNDDACQSGEAEIYAEVETAADSNGKVNKSNCFLRFSGDPTNWVTAQCVCESALCLILEKKSLPPKSDDGFGTAAEILGGSLLKRLKNSKVRPVYCSTNVRKATDKYEFNLFN